MATIRKIQRQHDIAYKAIVKQHGVAIKSKTFDPKANAVAWSKRVEADQDLMEAFGLRGASMKFSELVNECAMQWQGNAPG